MATFAIADNWLVDTTLQDIDLTADFLNSFFKLAYVRRRLCSKIFGGF